MSAATEKISKVIDKITKWVQENPELAATIGNIAMNTGKWIAILGTAAIAIGSVTFIVGQFGKVFRIVSDSIKIGTKIVSEYKNGMLLFRMQYALFSVWSKIAAAGQWVFNTSLYGCPVVWIVAGIMAIIAAVVLLVKYGVEHCNGLVLELVGQDQGRCGESLGWHQKYHQQGPRGSAKGMGISERLVL